MNHLADLTPLNEDSLAEGVAYLTQQDADLTRIYAAYGLPPLWARSPGFSTLVHIILEQQVSLASAKAAHERLLAICSPLTPSCFLSLDDSRLKACGFSRQKTRYCRGLAQAIIAGDLALATFPQLNDAQVYEQLTALKGIGPWTANIYLLMALGRPDIWPPGDLALLIAYQKLKNLSERPSQADLQAISQVWSPWRSVAARLLWHYYLNRPR